MIYLIPVLGWAIGLMFSIFIAIPFFILWNWLAPTYLYWLPEAFHHLPYWHCVGLFMLASMIRFALYPRLISSNTTTK